jgi:WD40 repeat protein/transcriptional regulator with XRE-family HTH domain
MFAQGEVGVVMDQTLASNKQFSFSTFGEMLKYLRRREHLTQLELSISVGYSEAQISRLEKNQRLPDLTTLKALFVPALHLENDPQMVAQLLDLAQSARQEEPPAPGIAPYKGLLFFDETDSELFFGREALIERLSAHMIGLSAGNATRFLAVVGASGSGKSSLVRAGLAVTLKRAGWSVSVFTPGANPVPALENKLASLHLESLGRHLIVVDQFEEVFTLCHDELQRISFIDKLISCAQDPSKVYCVVIALRADFYSHCAQYPFLRQAVAAQQEYIGQMDAHELRRAIEQPAVHGGWQLEPGLVDVLLNDIGAGGSSEPEPGALPLLSHALLATWERRCGVTFTLDGYRASGGVRGAIAETAESVYTDKLNLAQQEIARQVFIRLTELGEGTEDTRRRASLQELARGSAEAVQIRTVLDTLAEARLITINEDSAEVAHEALIREWQRLHDWLMADREGLRLHRHLTESSQEWETRGHDPADLYRGARLAQAQEWALANEDLLNSSEKAFLAASLELEKREESERESQRQRELEAAHQLAETQARAAKNLRRRAFYLVGALFLAVVTALAAGLFAYRSSVNFTRSDAQRLAAEANSLMDSGADPQLIGLLSLRSMDIQHTLEGDTALNGAARLVYPAQTFQINANEGVWSVAFSPDGKTVLTGQDNDVRLWDVQTGQQLHQFPGDIQSTAGFSPDGREIFTTYGQGVAQLWDLQTGQAIQQFSGDKTFILAATYSPDGKYLATGGLNNLATLWDTTTGQQVRQFTGPDTVTALAFSPDGQYLVTASMDKTAILWQVDTGKQVRVFSGHAGEVWSVAFSPDGKYIVTGSHDQTARLWDVQTGQSLRQFTGHLDWVNAVAISPDGRLVATGSSDKTVKLWDIQTGNEVGQFSGQPGAIFCVAFSPDGRYLLSGGVDGSIWMWDLQHASGEYPPLNHDHSVYSVAFTPDGQQVVSAGADNVIRLWDVHSGKEVREFKVPDGSILSVAVSPDGQYFLTGGDSGVARTWDLNTGNIILSLPGHRLGVTRVAISPNGSFIATSSDDGFIRIWDAQTGQLIIKFVNDPTVSSQPIPNRPYGVSFSPDGKLVLAPGDGSTVGLWDAQTGHLLRELNGHSAEVLGVAFSPDGHYAVTGGMDQTAIIWDVQSGNVLHRLVGHTAYIYDVAFSPDGKLVLTASADNTVRLWDVSTGQEVRRYTGHTGPVDGVSFSPDGKVFATASVDGTVRLWDVDYHATVNYLCSRLLRDFTAQERQTYQITGNTATCPKP